LTALPGLGSVPLASHLRQEDLLRVYALVPAAGRGTRFGGAKLLAKWNERELLGHVLLALGGARAAGLVSNTIVVHAPEDEAVRSLIIDYHAHPVAARSALGELSDTLRAGIEAVSSRETGLEPSALLICLGDQPLLRIEVIRALVEAWRTSGLPAVRPAYRDSPGEPGHPLLLDRSLWRLAAELRGESGLAPVLAARGIAIRSIPVGGRNPDVDTREDLSALDAREDAAQL